MKATPQVEDGYTRIANELFEVILFSKFTQRQLLVIFSIIRKTYGYGKKTDDMSAAQIGQICGMERNHVTEVIGQLVQINVLTRAPGAYGLILGVNKNHHEWLEKDASPKSGLVPNREDASPNLGQVDSPKLGHTKENLPKENQKKEPRQEKSFKKWMEECRELDVLPIRKDDSIFEYAEKLGIEVDYIRYAWIEFKRKYSSSTKKYKNWSQHFGNAVRENWYGLWFEKDGVWHLTTRGKQVAQELRMES